MKINTNLILKRFNKLDNLIQKLEDLKQKDKNEFISNYLFYLSAQRALETCINICIDIGNHILSLNKIKPETYSSIFKELAKKEIINEELMEKLIKMVKFRNLLGHFYMEVNNEIVYDILQNDLGDFIEFKKQIILKFKEQLEE